MIDPLPPELETLFESERIASTAPAFRAAVRVRLAASVGMPIGAALGAGKVLATLAIVAGLGAGAAAILGREGPALTPAAPTAVETVAHGELIAPGEPTPSILHDEPRGGAVRKGTTPIARTSAQNAAQPHRVREVVSAPIAHGDSRHSIAHTSAMPHVSAAPAAHDASHTPAPSRAPTELELLTAAWRALPIDPPHALALVDGDNGGSLAEERDALRVLALARIDRDRARVAAQTFFAAHPDSVYRPRITSSLESP